MVVVASGAAMGGSGENWHLLNNLRQHLHGGGGSKKDHQTHTPKGCLAVMVGQPQGGEEQRRFVVPVAYLSHPRFLQLLKEAEEEYGFDHQGAISIPCHVADFLSVQGLIDRDISHSLHHGGGDHGHHHNFHHNLRVSCFRA